MTQIQNLLKYISLPFVFITAGMSIYALLEPTVNWYKVGFFFFLMLSNMNTFLVFGVRRD